MKKLFSVLLITIMLSTMMFSTIGEASAKRVLVSISASSQSIVKGKSFKLKAKSSIKSKFKWSTSKKSVATISKTTSKSGQYITVKGKNVGKSTIKATAKDSSKLSLTCKVTVVKKPALSKSSLYMYNSNTYKLTVKGGSGKITWSTSNNSVAKVDSSGVVTAYKAGYCYITAKRNGISMKCKVTVYAFYSDYGFKDVYDFGAAYGLKIADKYEKEDIENDAQYYLFYYDLGGRAVSATINDYEKKLESKGFEFDSQESYSYGVTDYYYIYYSNGGWLQVAVTDRGGSVVTVSVLAPLSY